MRVLRRQKTQIQIGFLAIDPRNGHVKAWVGSRDFEQEAFDHVQQARRQPGSTFKPFVYGEAYRQGASPNDRLIDQAVEIDVGGAGQGRPVQEGSRRLGAANCQASRHPAGYGTQHAVRPGISVDCRAANPRLHRQRGHQEQFARHPIVQ
jgi:hypothetical protein